MGLIEQRARLEGDDIDTTIQREKP